MGLSNDLISQFIKATRDEKTKSTESTVYATAAGPDRVLIDGASIETPVSSTVKMKAGERVIVQIKDHSATVIGNMSMQSARDDDVADVTGRVDEFENINADVVTADQLNAEKARIDALIANDITVNETLTAHAALITSLSSEKVDTDFLAAHYATIESLDATNANIYNLSGTHASFAETTTIRLDAIVGTIADLDVEKLSATDGDFRYANIDFANVGDAAIEYLYSKSGLIENVIVSEGTVTGTLAGVTIKGDMIEGNTIVAEKLVIKGDDGLFYKLNTDGVQLSAEQTEYNSLNGQIITAKSITAEKVNVDDLVAFDATIGGFNITGDSLFSGVKESVDNSTVGVYLGADGQVAFGDADNYIKFYAVYAYYSVTYDASTSIYTRTNTEVTARFGGLVEGAVTTDGYKVYALTDVNGTTSYFCKVPIDYKLAISADSILFGTDSKYSMDDIKQLTDHVKIGSYVDLETGEQLPCVELSEMDSSFKMRLTNKSATFADGISDSTVIDSDGIETENLRVKNDIRHYDYVWRRRANGNLGLMWMEVTE